MLRLYEKNQVHMCSVTQTRTLAGVYLKGEHIRHQVVSRSHYRGSEMELAEGCEAQWANSKQRKLYF